MNDPSQTHKPVEPTHQAPSSSASNPRQVRSERPGPRTQSVGTPDGGGTSKPPPPGSSVGGRK